MRVSGSQFPADYTGSSSGTHARGRRGGRGHYDAEVTLELSPLPGVGAEVRAEDLPLAVRAVLSDAQYKNALFACTPLVLDGLSILRPAAEASGGRGAQKRTPGADPAAEVAIEQMLSFGASEAGSAGRLGGGNDDNSVLVLLVTDPADESRYRLQTALPKSGLATAVPGDRLMLYWIAARRGAPWRNFYLFHPATRQGVSMGELAGLTAPLRWLGTLMAVTVLMLMMLMWMSSRG